MNASTVKIVHGTMQNDQDERLYRQACRVCMLGWGECNVRFGVPFFGTAVHLPVWGAETRGGACLLLFAMTEDGQDEVKVAIVTLRREHCRAVSAFLWARGTMLEDAGGVAIQVRIGVEGRSCHECGSAILTTGKMGTRIPTNVCVRT